MLSIIVTFVVCRLLKHGLHTFYVFDFVTCFCSPLHLHHVNLIIWWWWLLLWWLKWLSRYSALEIFISTLSAPTLKLLLLLLVWHAPLGVLSTKRRHQSPEWTILSHSYRLIQWEIVRPQRLLDLRSCWIVFIQFSEGEAVMILLASVSSGILAKTCKTLKRYCSKL